MKGHIPWVALVVLAGCGGPQELESSTGAPLQGHPGARWPMNAAKTVVVPYEFHNGPSPDFAPVSATDFQSTTADIKTAMAFWESTFRRPDGTSLFKFVPHNGEGRWVDFQVHQTKFGGCKVNPGATKTVVASDPWCNWKVFVHEIGHVFTYDHEQKRYDRPTAVVWNKNRTDPSQYGQFTPDPGTYLTADYDSTSVMHYGSCSFHLLNPCGPLTSTHWVMSRIKGTPFIKEIWDRQPSELFSAGDICGTKKMYGLPCGTVAPGPDAGTPGPDAGQDAGHDAGRDAGPDASTPRPDAGLDASTAGPDAGPDAGADAGPDASVGDGGPTDFPVDVAAAGTLQQLRGGEWRCAEVTSSGVSLTTCDPTRPAQDVALTSVSQLRNPTAKKCFEPSAATAGAAIAPRDCTPVDAQRFNFSQVELVNGQSGQCATVATSDIIAGQRVVSGACTRDATQLFDYFPDTHELKIRGTCVQGSASAYSNLALADCDGSARQQWLESGGGFAIAANANLCLRVQSGAGSPEGTPLEVAACNGKVGQMWGLRGQVFHADDRYCLAATSATSPLTYASCATSPNTNQTFVWWPHGTCAPSTCADLGATCGTIDDGCGKAVDCGACTPTDNTTPDPLAEDEFCVPTDCATAGATCGVISDECGGALDCGPCPDAAMEAPPEPIDPGEGGCGCSEPGTAFVGVGAALLAGLRLVRRRRPAR